MVKLWFNNKKKKKKKRNTKTEKQNPLKKRKEQEMCMKQMRNTRNVLFLDKQLVNMCFSYRIQNRNHDDNTREQPTDLRFVQTLD